MLAKKLRGMWNSSQPMTNCQILPLFLAALPSKFIVEKQQNSRGHAQADHHDWHNCYRYRLELLFGDLGRTPCPGQTGWRASRPDE